MPVLSKRAALVGGLVTLLLGIAACGSPKGTPTASAVASAEPPPVASSAAPSEPPPPPPPAGTGATKFLDPAEAKCALVASEVAQYLSRGELAIATTPTEIALAWLVQGRGDAKIGVGAYDPQGKRVMRDRSVADTKSHGPMLYPGTGGDWIVAWFEEDGLAFVRTRKEPDNRYDIGKFSLMKGVPLEDLAIAPTPDGSFVAASPFGTGGTQLTVFTFSSSPTAPSKESVGMTRSATAPKGPVVAADADGFLLVWSEADGHLRSVRLDAAGKSKGGASMLLGPAVRAGLTLLPSTAGFYLTWTEGTTIASAVLTKDGTIGSPPVKLGEGKSPRAAVSGADLLVTYLADGEKLVVVRSAAGAGPTAGIRVADVAKDPPVIGVAGTRVGVFTTEPIPAVATRRAVLRTIDAACIP